MKAGTKINHIITCANKVAEDHPGCKVHLEIRGYIDENGMIKGSQRLKLESPGTTEVHHNVSLDTMIVMVQEWSKSLG